MPGFFPEKLKFVVENLKFFQIWRNLRIWGEIAGQEENNGEYDS